MLHEYQLRKWFGISSFLCAALKKPKDIAYLKKLVQLQVDVFLSMLSPQE